MTWVSVLPTYRRRGVLTHIMRRQLADVRDRGEPLAVLWASESAIYSRFGYGRATWHLAFTVRRGEGALAKTVRADGGLSLRLADPAAALPELAKVFDSVLPPRPGLFARSEHWWQRVIYDPADDRQGVSPLRCLVAEDGSGPRGDALYAGRGRPDDMFLPNDLITVGELMAADAQASAALWTDLLSRDLTSEFRASKRPVDDPLLYQLADPRRARPQLTDGLWVRIISLPAALARRRYSGPVDVVIEVRDDILPSNAGRWRLTAGGMYRDVRSGGRGLGGRRGAGCHPARRGLPGRYQARGARRGRLVTELRPGAVRRLSTAMSWDPAPWRPTVF